MPLFQILGARSNLEDLSGSGGKLAEPMARNEEKTGGIKARIAESKSGIAERAEVLRQSLSFRSRPRRSRKACSSRW